MPDYDEIVVKSGKGLFTGSRENKKHRIPKLNRTLVERVIIVILSVFIVTSAAIYFVGIPAMNKLSETRAEVAMLRVQQESYAAMIANKDTYEEESMQKTVELNNAAAKFGTLMAAEELDEYITELLMQNNMTITSLKMTALTSANIPPYLSASETYVEDSAISEYTVTVEADGSRSNLYGLIDTVAEQSGVELVSYSWSETGSKVTGTEVEKPGMSLVFKVYVV
jgi:PHD/YefM family antitoxin component YafN of YafNO toxin-antitoxin module